MYRFRDKDNHFEYCVKEEFLERLPNPENYGPKEIIADNGVDAYLHNTTGPAIISIKNPGHEKYFVDGKELEGEELEKFMHNLNFNKKVMDELQK